MHQFEEANHDIGFHLVKKKKKTGEKGNTKRSSHRNKTHRKATAWEVFCHNRKSTQPTFSK